MREFIGPFFGPFDCSAALLVLGGLLAGCGESVDDEQARALYERLSSERYREWTRAPGWEQAQITIRPHGSTAEIFLNPDLVAALSQTGLNAWPTGSITVKDSDGGKLLAAMEKTDGAWFYAEWDRDGSVKYAGSPEVCTNCHRAGSDFVFAVALP